MPSWLMWSVEPNSAGLRASDDDDDDEVEEEGAAALGSGYLQELGVSFGGRGGGKRGSVLVLGKDDEKEKDGDDDDAPSLVPRMEEVPSQRTPPVTDESVTYTYVPPRRIHDVCFLCGDATHRASFCPEERCRVCLQRGHRSQECPTGDRISVCSECGHVGHKRAECPVGRTPLPNTSQCRCVACGRLGHVDCTPYERRPRKPSCLNCGGNGHTALDCPIDGTDRWQRLFSVALGSGLGVASGKGMGGGGKGVGGGKGMKGMGELSSHVGHAPRSASGRSGGGKAGRDGSKGSRGAKGGRHGGGWHGGEQGRGGGAGGRGGAWKHGATRIVHVEGIQRRGIDKHHHKKGKHNSHQRFGR